MEVLQIIIGILLGLLSLVLIALILFQQGHRAGISGAISGAAETFLSKNKARTADAALKRYTMIGAIVFFVLAIAATVVATIIA
ncbi:MAG: preprotein translocase subunit SecG [Acutalibacteraceae bacterium]|nr:preprotein translocase subunit SecG [Acutalibacteraceae bacterium]